MSRLNAFLSSVVLSTLLIGIIGCSYEDDGYVIETMSIEYFQISVSESRPAYVTVKVKGWYGGCDRSHETQHWIEGNTINIEVTVKHPTGSGFECPEIVHDYHEEIHIGSFGTGEYIVQVEGLALFPGRFRIEEDESWIIRELDHAGLDIVISESRPAQVSVQVDGYFIEECLEFLETHQARDGNTLDIRIVGEIPVSGNCLPKFGGDVANAAYQAVIDIGTLTNGYYEVILNDRTAAEFWID